MPKRKASNKAGEAAPAKRGAQAALVIEPERANFKTLLLKNPNFFGTLPDLGFTPVKVMSQKTTSEELTCIGLHPEGERLQAVVNIKRHSGYGGGTCDDGSVEYVRFYVRRPSGWHDLGVASFTSHDLPAASPLPVSYSVEMALDEARRYCTVENVVEVRGILSWNWEPPAGSPDWTPPWGNVRDVRVQIAPWDLPKVSIATLIEDKLLTIDPSILAAVDVDLTLKAKTQPQALQYAALKEKYKGKDVPGHRSGFVQAQKLLAEPLSAELLAQRRGPGKVKKAAAQAVASPLLKVADAALLTDLSDILDGLVATSGNRTFEELECAGYNPETRMLSGVIAIKRNSGYSGDLCDPGSIEYVGFWVFHGGSWHALGTAQVRVHDLAAVTPGNPVRYAVFRGVNLPEHLCADITGLPLRAILSWQTPPTGPGFPPVWGNVVNTHVQPIIVDELPGDQRVRLMRINRVNVINIGAGGFAHDAIPPDVPIAGDCTDAEVNNSPFGGPLFIEGDFTVKSDAFFHPATGAILPGQHPPAYQVFVQRLSAPAWPSPTQLTNAFNIAVFPANPAPGDPPAVTVTQSVQAIGGAEYYLYREGIVQAVNPRMLAVWEASGLDEGRYEIEVKGFVWNGLTYVPMASPSQTERVYVYNGYPHTELDTNGDPFTVLRPEVELHITSPSGDCGDVVVGDILSGTYRVRDNYFGSFGIGLVQITVGGIPQPINPVIPSGLTVYPDVGTHGTGLGTWTLDTTGMTPCGYTIVLHAWDRALVANGCHGHYNQIGVGFCLREPEP